MEILESIGYIALGFLPTLALLETSYSRMGKKIDIQRRVRAIIISVSPIVIRT